MSDPRLGHNRVPYDPEGLTDWLQQDYGELLSHARDLLADADELPSTVESSLDLSAVAAITMKLRDLAARAESHRKAEKEPWLRQGEVVDTFFFKLKQPLDAKRNDLQGRLDTFKQKQLAAERARREAEAAAARKAQIEALRQREEAELAARRARTLETQTAREITAATARVDAALADIKAEETALAAMASSSSLVRERFQGDRSGMVGMRKKPVCIIEDVSKLDLELLRPYLKEEALLLALRAWAKTTGYSQEMPGAIVALRDSVVVR
jgi:hypothetical protein